MIFASCRMKYIGCKNNIKVSKSGTKANPAVVRVHTEKKAIEIYRLCEQKGWKVIVGIEPDENEDISDVEKLLRDETVERTKFKMPPSRNAPCPCGSGKQYKRCCGK